MLALGFKTMKRPEKPRWGGSFHGPEGWILQSKRGIQRPSLLWGQCANLAWEGGSEKGGSGTTALLYHYRE